ncbi:hypothetical protein [Oceanicoccus sp. KOV_DT_Chl]|uniref:hypothetical protein n=1 Tax=Oceanicoccus sp. KOV_DT_Chl TaxID=1904639 RepID=UPI000C7D1867|nr:hypothetical protein [Oceanicoccus sp. KOV_DT_Chl]
MKSLRPGLALDYWHLEPPKAFLLHTLIAKPLISIVHPLRKNLPMSRADKQQETINAVTEKLTDEISLSGRKDKIKNRLHACQQSRAASLSIAGDELALTTMAELIL